MNKRTPSTLLHPSPPLPPSPIVLKCTPKGVRSPPPEAPALSALKGGCGSLGFSGSPPLRGVGNRPYGSPVMCSAATPKNDLLRKIVHLMEERDELRERLNKYERHLREAEDTSWRLRHEVEARTQELAEKQREIDTLVPVSRKLGQEIVRLRGEG